MARSELVKQMFLSYQQGDDVGFRRAAHEVVEEERRKRHVLVANELEQILERGRGGPRPLNISSLKPLPTTRSELPLIDLERPETRFQDLVLAEETTRLLTDVVGEYRQRDILQAHGLRPRRKLLFVGPPGSGKSKSAEAVASALGLPLARLELAAVVSSFLGETSQNLKQVLDFCENGSWVLLLDEIDMLAKERGDQTEHGELRRVVAAFLQILDDFQGDSIVIATTNHASLLDRAVWRRFDEVVAFGEPTADDIERLIRLKLSRFRLSFEPQAVREDFEGFSHAEIELACQHAARVAVLDGRPDVRMEDLRGGIDRLSRRRFEVEQSQT